LARQFVIEIETHPAKPDEYRFLTSGEILRWVGDIPISDRFMLRASPGVPPEADNSGSSSRVTYFPGTR
jgi:hypothetical protein